MKNTIIGFLLSATVMASFVMTMFQYYKWFLIPMGLPEINIFHFMALLGMREIFSPEEMIEDTFQHIIANNEEISDEDLKKIKEKIPHLLIKYLVALVMGYFYHKMM